MGQRKKQVTDKADRTAEESYGVCPICQRRLKLKTRRDGRTVFPTHGHLIATRVNIRQAPRCPTSGFSTQGVVIIQGAIDGLVALARFSGA
jgi:hypothetical protein